MMILILLLALNTLAARAAYKQREDARKAEHAVRDWKAIK